MGLDWNPIGKPKPGHEAEFERLFHQVAELPVDPGFFTRLRLKFRGIDAESIRQRWFDIQISPFDTLDAPIVGVHPQADAWARERWREQTAPTMDEAAFLRSLDGYHVLQLVPRCDGLPWYSNGGLGTVELFSFRAQALHDCEDILDPALLARCHDNALAPGLARLAADLRAAADRYAAIEDVGDVADRYYADLPAGSPASKAHILYSAARWGEFWSSRGHGLEAYW